MSIDLNHKSLTRRLINVTSLQNKSALKDSSWDVNWGLKNPVTGVDRAQCGDSVGWGSWGSTDKEAVNRFHGQVGQTYTVECPDGCDNAGPVWGCGTFLDDSSICKAAILMGMASKDKSSVVSFQLVEPLMQYPDCKKNGISTDSWMWYEWKKASKVDKVQSYCPAGWLNTHTIDQPCEALLRKYRWDCKISHDIEHCFGVRAFQFVQASTPPSVNPPSGQFIGTVKVTVTAPAGERILCTTDGSDPRISDALFDNLVSGQQTFELKSEGKNTLKCQAIASGSAASIIIVREYEVLTKLPAPSFDPNGGSFVEEALVVISCSVANVVLKYYLDENQPSMAKVYNGPVRIQTTGSKIFAYATGHPILKDSDISASNSFFIQAKSPGIALPGAISVGFAIVNVTVQRPDEQAFCTSDGSTPTRLSNRCDQHGIMVMNNHARVKALVVGNDVMPSNITTSDLITIRSYAPVIEPDGGRFQDMAEVSLDYPAPGLYKIYFTLNGRDPDAKSSEYTTAISIVETRTIVKAFAISGDLEPSLISVSDPYIILSLSPALQPPAGQYVDQVTVTLICTDPTAKIFYTLDGRDPNTNSDQYKSPIVVKNNGTYLRAISKSPKKDPSEIVQAEYSIKTATPQLTGAEGAHETVAEIHATCTSQNAKLYYTLDGSIPNQFSQRAQNNKIQVKATGSQVKVIAISDRKEASDVVTTDTIVVSTAIPTIIPNGGDFVDVATVSISSATPGAEIYYTLDGSTPTAQSRMYVAPVLVESTDVVVKAMARHHLLEDSEVISSDVFHVHASVPTFEPDGGSFVESVEVTISSATPGAEIRCTTDGSEPSETTSVCQNPVTISTTGAVIKAIATKHELSPSEVAVLQAPFVIKAMAPSFSPDGGTYVESVKVTLSSQTAGSRIYYTLDGSTPTAESNLYGEPIELEGTGTVVRAVAVAEGKAPSEVAESREYVIETSPVEYEASGDAWGTATASEKGFIEEAKITMTSKTPGAQIYYTMDDSNPTVSSTRYDGVAVVDKVYGERVVKAIAEAPGKAPSSVTTSVIFDVFQREKKPRLLPDGPGPYVTRVKVSIEAQPGDSVRYTTDGSDPSSSSTAEEYKEGFDIDAIGVTEVRAVASKAGMADSLPMVQSYTVLEQVKTPTISPSSGLFTHEVDITLACATQGASIHYTTDGSEPNAASPVYTGQPITLTDDGTRQQSFEVKAIAIKAPSMGDSEVAQSGAITVQPQVMTPVIEPAAPGPYEDGVNVTIYCNTPGSTIYWTDDGSTPTKESNVYTGGSIAVKQTGVEIRAVPNMGDSEVVSSPSPGAEIYYTLDGSTPTAQSRMYVAPVLVESTDVVVKAMARHHLLEDSEVISSDVFHVHASVPTFEPDGGSFVESVEVTISSATPGAEIRCTTDGSEPSETTSVCQNPVTISATGAVIKAIATKHELSPSEVAVLQAPFVIKAMAPSFSPDGGTYVESVKVTLSSQTAGSRIYYTLDGSTPTAESNLYGEPIELEGTGTVVRAVAVAEGKAPSEVAESREYVIETSPVEYEASGDAWGTATASEKGFIEEAKITMTSKTPGAQIYYTMDDSNPTVSSTRYDGVAVVDKVYGERVVKAIAEAPGKAPSSVTTSVIFDVFQREKKPRLLPDGPGPYVTRVKVSIEAQPGDSVRYTTDGSDPSSSSTAEEYKEGFDIDAIGVTEVRAVASKAGMADSLPMVQSYTVLEQVKTPTISPSSGLFTHEVDITLACATQGASIHYTTDGSEPNAASPVYTGQPITLTDDGTRQQSFEVKAIAIKAPSMGDSEVAQSGAITVQPQVRTPMIEPAAPGPYEDGVNVTIYCNTPGSTIYWTDDGSTPTKESNVYTGGSIAVKQTGVEIRAVAVADKMAGSEVASSGVYDVTAAKPSIKPDGGDFVDVATVSISSATPGAEIYYTLDGSVPTEQSSRYTVPISLFSSARVSAIAFSPGVLASPVVLSEAFRILPHPPLFSSSGGFFLDEAKVYMWSPTKGRNSLYHRRFDSYSRHCRLPFVSDDPSICLVNSTSIFYIKTSTPMLSQNGGEIDDSAFINFIHPSKDAKFFCTFNQLLPKEQYAPCGSSVYVNETGTVLSFYAAVDGQIASAISHSLKFIVMAGKCTFFAIGKFMPGANQTYRIEYFVDEAWVIIGSRTPGAKIMYITNKMSWYSYDPEEKQDCCYGYHNFYKPIQIWAKGYPTVITAVASAPGKTRSRTFLSPLYKLFEQLRDPVIEPAGPGPFKDLVEVDLLLPIIIIIIIIVVVILTLPPQVSIGRIKAGSVPVVVRYTLDGSEPSCSSGIVYTKPIFISKIGETTLRAIGCAPPVDMGTDESALSKNGYTDSRVVTTSYIVQKSS
ncbi:hypothetical protein GUITHDRAFT_104774 [Guillardia theta CCMP2712]|uniref:Uncharacterized protein n=1 Tax=Guillardia theta (strain CCMP2712) TaxID=905079 RepID=L1JM46_GUITC|nr:hypothetical protein GUITHDRAFT_104774 [Guillardia theta CCMP2712]EKX49245.1 hypothetical protein GUITHDRAFT_104774 [Guillardia theta CCMP2712]|eukprot:XP_005836225.1 hypothetical protein GUITHDRAFT_104774 [Guillardia theta CCMP2712]